MSLLVFCFWPLLAPRRWRCFSALRSAFAVWVVCCMVLVWVWEIRIRRDVYTYKYVFTTYQHRQSSHWPLSHGQIKISGHRPQWWPPLPDALMTHHTHTASAPTHTRAGRRASGARTCTCSRIPYHPIRLGSVPSPPPVSTSCALSPPPRGREQTISWCSSVHETTHITTPPDKTSTTGPPTAWCVCVAWVPRRCPPPPRSRPPSLLAPRAKPKSRVASRGTHVHIYIYI